ncbi:hypothetical protein AcV7_008406 [Taiwanofungus camphoratus]|nr:hypothetical protein AcV7_008406 [Antrodia cinnamomea]
MSSLFLICVSFYVFCAYVTLVASKRDSRSGRQRPTTSGGFALPESAHSWAMYTPYYPLDDYARPPQDCEIVQVSVVCRLHRSIAIVPVQSRGPRTSTSCKDTGARYHDEIGQQGDQEGAEEAAGRKEVYGPPDVFPPTTSPTRSAKTKPGRSGLQSVLAVRGLISKEKLPVRAGFEQTAGGGFGDELDSRYVDVVKLMPGSRRRKDSRRPATRNTRRSCRSSCRKAPTTPWTTRTARTPGQRRTGRGVQAVYAPNITAALNAYAPGADLDDDDTGSLMSLCPFETVAKMGRSGFCGLFEQLGAFAGYEYAGDGGGGGVGC